MACPVNINDIRVPNEHDNYPDKVKAKGCCSPIWEVNIYGEKI